MKIDELEKQILKELTVKADSVTHVGLGDKNCKVGGFALGVTYGKSTNIHEHIEHKWCEPYWSFKLGETRDISLEVIKAPEINIGKAYYIIYNTYGEVQVYDELTVIDNNLVMLYNACFRGVFNVEFIAQIGQQVLIFQDEVEVR